MKERLFDRLGKIIKRSRESNKEPIENQYDPKTSAEDFARIVQASTPYHLEIGNVQAFFLNLDPDPRIPEYKDRLEERANEILQRPKITQQFRTYIVSQLLTEFQMGMALSPEYKMREYAGIDLEKGEYGIFDPRQAKQFEKKVLRSMLTHEDELSMMFATGVAGINLDEWGKAFRHLHREKPA